MQFTAKKRRQPPPVIIISLIDILIVLLIFMMVSTTFREQPAVKLTLPESRQKPTPGVTESSAIVTVTKEPNYYIGKERVAPEKLETELIELAKKNPQITLAIRIDTDSTMGPYLKVMDAATAAKIKSMKIFTKKAIQP